MPANDRRRESLGGHPGVDGSCVQFGMTEQRLDHPNVDFALEQMGGEGVSIMSLGT
jgi:hypothetical protein